MDRELYYWQIVSSYPPWDLRASTALVLCGDPNISRITNLISPSINEQFTWFCILDDGLFVLIDFSNAIVWYSNFMELVCFLTPDPPIRCCTWKHLFYFLEQHPILVNATAEKTTRKCKGIIRHHGIRPDYNLCPLTEMLSHHSGIHQPICRHFILNCSEPEYLFTR